MNSVLYRISILHHVIGCVLTQEAVFAAPENPTGHVAAMATRELVGVCRWDGECLGQRAVP